MLDAKAREALGGLRSFTGRTLARAGATPDALTTLGILLTGLAGFLVVRGEFFWGGFVLVLGGVLDFCDGAVASATGRATRRGAFFDSVADRISDAVILSCLLWVYVQRGDDTLAALCLVAMVTASLTSYIRAKAESIGFDAKVGLLERAERLIIVMAGLLLSIMAAMLWLLAVLGVITVVQRLVHVFRQGRVAA